jgi:hypothetical protein
VESDELRAEEVVSGLETAWDGEVDLASAGDQSVDTPLGSIVTILVDLEPTYVVLVMLIQDCELTYHQLGQWRWHRQP